jgi:siroheme decarboxylase
MSEIARVDQRDRELLQWLQDEFPVTERPWLAGGVRLGMTEEEVLCRVRRLSSEGVIRSVHAILDRQKSGAGSSTLVAMRVPEQKISSVVPVINEYPSITHNYLREHDFNIWFTVSARDERELEDTVDDVRRRTEVRNADILDLRTRRVFKTDVRFSFFEGARILRTGRGPVLPLTAMDETDRTLLRISQQGIPLVEEPFGEIAGQLHLGQADVLQRLERRVRDETIRRIGGSVSQRKLGIIANAVVAWRVPNDLVDRAGTNFSSYDEVTHCYERSTTPGVWDYTLFTVLHGYSREWVETFAQRLSETTGISGYLVIFSRTQFKRTSMIHELENGNGNREGRRYESNRIPVQG